MKSIKYVIVSLVLALGFAVPSMNAQDGAPKAKHDQRGGGDMYASLLKGITLTAEQQTKIDAIKSEAHAKMQGLSQEERRGKAREIMEDTSKKIRDVLTSEQQATFDANRKAFASQRGGKGGGDKGGKGGGKPGKGPKAGAGE